MTAETLVHFALVGAGVAQIIRVALQRQLSILPSPPSVLRLASMRRSATRSVGCDQPSDFIDRQHVSIGVSGREQLRPNVFFHRPRLADELGPFSEDPLYFSPSAQVTKPELPVHSRPSIGLAQHCAV
jgi:hypothetical protein